MMITAINSPHNNAGRRKGAITENNQVAVLLSQVCMRMKSTTINRMQGEGGSLVGPHVKVTCTFGIYSELL
jgi:hypothetical protein